MEEFDNVHREIGARRRMADGIATDREPMQDVEIIVMRHKLDFVS